MKSTNKIHYVYKITNLKPTDERIYYIGVRSTIKASPEEDTSYNSSSKYLKESIREIGCQYFKKEILSIWKTRKLANQEEIRLHNLFDVAKNPIYYNKSKAIDNGFCTEGVKLSKETIDKRNKTVNSIEWKINVGKLATAKMINTRETNNSFVMGGLKCSKTKQSDVWKKSIGLEASKKISLTKQSSSWKLEIEPKRIIKFNESMRTVIDQSLTRLELRNIRDSETKLSSEWKKEVGDKQYKELSKTRIEKGLAKGKNNPKAIKINIYNSQNELVFKCFGDFEYVCLMNGLPFMSFKNSYQTNTRLYESDIGRKRVTNTKNEKFIGWYALKIE